MNKLKGIGGLRGDFILKNESNNSKITFKSEYTENKKLVTTENEKAEKALNLEITSRLEGKC